MKKYSFFIFALALCLCLCACKAPVPTVPNEPNLSDQKGSADQAEDNTNHSQNTPPPPSEEHYTDTPAAAALDIQTIGGVVLVGKIGYDQAGWYIATEQPLNITYNYFYDKPSVFLNQINIRLIDTNVDGIDKSIYLGQTVTVYGEFRFVRNDFETLYLYPYTITIGKIVEQSYGDSELKPPKTDLDLYDRSQPLPKYMEPLLIKGQYAYNAFMLSEETLQVMGNDFTYFYCDFVDAVLCYRSSVPCPQKVYAEMLSTIIYYEFPIFNACAEPFEFLKHYDSKTNTVNISYLYSAEDHQKLLNKLLQSADELLYGVTPDMSDIQKAKNIYHNLCTRMVYDDSALQDISRKDSHFAYLYNSGVCVTFANVYNQLLTQVGIKATLAACHYDATMGHVWSVVTLNGKDYFCDPTFELSCNDGSGYVYFGMNYADRTKTGLGKDGIWAGKYGFSYTVLPQMLAEQSLHE